MVATVAVWTIGAVLHVFVFFRSVKRAQVGLAAVAAVLILQVYVRPLIFFFKLDSPHPPYLFEGMEWSTLTVAISYSCLWIVFLLLFHTILNKAPVRFPGDWRSSSRRLNVQRSKFLALLVTAVGFSLTALLVLKAGSVGSFMLQTKVEKEMAGLYLIRSISVLGALFCAVPLLGYAKRWVAGGHESAGVVKLVALWTGVLLFNLSVNYLWGNRYNIAMVLMGVAMGWHLYVQKLSLLRMALLLAMAAFVLQLLKGVRLDAVGAAIGRDVDAGQEFWVNISTSLHLVQFDALSLAIRDAGVVFNFRLGEDFMNGLLAWIPRSLYPEKETFHVGVWFRQIYEPLSRNGWPVTVIGSWFVNFGAYGVAFGALVSGVVVSLFDRIFNAIPSSLWQAATVPTVAFLIFDGGVNTGFIQAIFLTIVPVLLMGRFLFTTTTVQKMR